MKRDHYGTKHDEVSGLTKRAWEADLPVARKKAGLPERAKPGPKKQTKK